MHNVAWLPCKTVLVKAFPARFVARLTDSFVLQLREFCPVTNGNYGTLKPFDLRFLFVLVFTRWNRLKRNNSKAIKQGSKILTSQVINFINNTSTSYTFSHMHIFLVNLNYVSNLCILDYYLTTLNLESNYFSCILMKNNLNVILY